MAENLHARVSHTWLIIRAKSFSLYDLKFSHKSTIHPLQTDERIRTDGQTTTRTNSLTGRLMKAIVAPAAPVALRSFVRCVEWKLRFSFLRRRL